MRGRVSTGTYEMMQQVAMFVFNCETCSPGFIVVKFHLLFRRPMYDVVRLFLRQGRVQKCCYLLDLPAMILSRESSMFKVT